MRATASERLTLLSRHKTAPANYLEHRSANDCLSNNHNFIAGGSSSAQIYSNLLLLLQATIPVQLWPLLFHLGNQPCGHAML